MNISVVQICALASLLVMMLLTPVLVSYLKEDSNSVSVYNILKENLHD